MSVEFLFLFELYNIREGLKKMWNFPHFGMVFYFIFFYPSLIIATMVPNSQIHVCQCQFISHTWRENSTLKFQLSHHSSLYTCVVTGEEVNLYQYICTIVSSFLFCYLLVKVKQGRIRYCHFKTKRIRITLGYRNLKELLVKLHILYLSSYQKVKIKNCPFIEILFRRVSRLMHIRVKYHRFYTCYKRYNKI